MEQWTKIPATKVADVALEIATDAEALISEYEGKPFTGQTIAAEFGETLALIHVLARLVSELAMEVAKK